jgi:arginase
VRQERQTNHPGRNRIRIFGVRSGVGGRDPGAREAADGLRKAGLAERLRAAGLDARWSQILESSCAHPGDPAGAIAKLAPRLAQATANAVSDGHFPLVIGGDHSCAIGTWSGIALARRAQGALGLLWVDAHLDSHTPQTSHTGLVYGMPLAALLGYGASDFTECAAPGPKLAPQHVCVLGARSYEPEERALLDRIGVRVIGMEEIGRRGMAAALAEALTIVRQADGGYGITIDLDALDPRDAPGVGTPAPGGLRAAELIPALAAAADRQLCGLEIAEYNPRRDRKGVTAAHAVAMAEAVLTAGAVAVAPSVARVA